MPAKKTPPETLSKRPLIFDGAMGTELQVRGLLENPAQLNLTHPEAILEIHNQYLAAGADVITANTFGAYSHKFENYQDIINAAMEIGRKALKGHKNKLLALDLGPTGLMLEPYGDTTPHEANTIFMDTIKTATAHKPDLVLIETMMDLTELEEAVSAASLFNLPVFATMTFDKNGRTMMGATIDEMVDLLESWKVEALGINCGFGPDAYTALATRLRKLTTLPIIVQPNAGIPKTPPPNPDGTIPQAIYDLPPEEFARTVADMNVDIVGGCCGTTPAHIKALADRHSKDNVTPSQTL